MPIKHLETYLHERKHVQTLPLNVLAESRLGIDASYYLQQLLDNPVSREPLLAATGGLPLALASHIEQDLRILDKSKVKPVFVFPGLPPNKRWKPNQHQHEYTEACKDRREAWAKYEAGQEDAATRLFESRGTIQQWDLWRMILRVFRHRNVEFMIAPYVAWAELIYLQRHQKSYIHAIYGPTETLLYPGVDKLITHIDFKSPSPSFSYVSKRTIVQDLGVSDEQFLDIGILVGFDQSPPFPPTVHDQALKATVDMVKYYKFGQAAVSAFSEHPAVKTVGYPEHFARTRAMVKNSLILTSEGTVTPLPIAIPPPHGHHPSSSDIPGDLHEVFSHRFPDEVYFYLSRGLIGPQALVWLASGQIIEPPPLDNGETNEFKRFVKEVITEGQTGPRATALALISSVLHNTWGKRQVLPYFWFESGGSSPSPSGGPAQSGAGKPVQHNSGQTTQLVERVSGWMVPYSTIEEELRRQNSSTIDFSLCLGATASDKLAMRTRSKQPSISEGKKGGKQVVISTPLEKKDEIVANVLFRFLELRGFLLNSHQHSPLARAMYASLKGARVNDKFQDSIYLFLELVRAGVMHGHLWSERAFSGGPSFGSDDEKKCMLLVMRVLSIVPLSFKNVPWSTPPLSRELLVFNSFLRSLTRALRTLLESTTLNLFISHHARRHPRDDFLDISIALPFNTGEVNTGFGILAKVYLDALTHFNGGERVRSKDAEGVRESKDMALEVCEEAFGGSVRNVTAEVERGFRFWDLALLAMRQLHSEGQVLKELIDQFEAAEAWLAPMRP